MKTIVMDSANKYLVVALYENQKCLASLQEEGNRKQSEYAIVYLQKFLKMSDFDEMVITIGPGSYTGVRVALTIAKTLNATMNIKVKTVSSLKAMAGMKKAISILDARSHKLFLGIYNEGKVIVDDCLINIDEFENYQKQYTDYEIVGDTHLVGIPDDLKRIVELEKDLFLSPWNEEDFIHELKENPMAGYYILEKENQIIGYIGLWFLGDQCQITTIATDRHFQGQGYASQLMEYALEKSEELHYQNVNLEVRVSNVKAIALYQKFGFKNVAVRKRYYSNGEDAYLMIKELEG